MSKTIDKPVTITLENELLIAEFDHETGALVGLQNKQTGWIIQGRPELGQTFQLLVPLPDRTYHLVHGHHQKIPRVERDASGTSICFSWKNLRSDYAENLDIRCWCSATLSEIGLIFEMKLDNRSPYTIESVSYPCIGDLSTPNSTDVLTRASFFHTEITFKSLWPRFHNERGYWGVEYPIQMVPTPENAFLLVLSRDEGLYVGLHDTSMKERVEFTFQVKPGHRNADHTLSGKTHNSQPVNLEFSAVHHPFIPTEESRNLPPVALKPFTGDWHAGADIYKTWRETWMKRPDSPKWADQIHAWHQIQMSSWGDTLNVQYTDLPDYGRDCVRHNVKAIQITGWTLYGQDGRLPNHETDPRFGSRKDLKDAIKKLRRMGIKVILYEKYTCADKTTSWFKEKLHRYSSRDIYGNTHGHEGWRYDTPAYLAGINTRPYAWMCMSSDKWQDIALEQIARSLELEPDGILLDECQWHGSNAFYCFDETHDHAVPAYNFAGDAQFENRLRQLLDQHNTQLLLAGEGPYDLQNRHYDLTYHRVSEGHTPGMRYIDPFLPIMNWVYGYDDRESINYCLLYRYIISYEPRHFRGKIDEFPLTIDYGTKVDALRRKYQGQLWDAEFRGTLGATVKTNGKDHTLYSVFRQIGHPSNKTVVIANHATDNLVATVQTDDNEDNFLLVTPETPEPQVVDNKILIPPRSVAVLLPNLL